MKNYLLLLLILVSTSCHKTEQPIAPVPDLATQVTGVYNLKYAFINNSTDTSLTGTLTLVRTDTKTVKPTLHIVGIEDSSVEQSIWSLLEINKDSILYVGHGYGGFIVNKQIEMYGYGNGNRFRFAKK